MLPRDRIADAKFARSGKSNCPSSIVAESTKRFRLSRFPKSYVSPVTNTRLFGNSLSSLARRPLYHLALMCLTASAR